MRHLEVRSFRAVTASARPDASHSARTEINLPRPSWSLLIVATAVVAGLTWGLARQRTSQIDPSQVIAVNLMAAKLALEDERWVEPAEHSAAYYYRMVLAIDPTNETARTGLASVCERLLDLAKHSILQGRFAAAVEALDQARRISPSHRRIPFVESELHKALEAHAASVRAERETTAAIEPPAATEPKNRRAGNANAEQVERTAAPVSSPPLTAATSQDELSIETSPTANEALPAEAAIASDSAKPEETMLVVGGADAGAASFMESAFESASVSDVRTDQRIAPEPVAAASVRSEPAIVNMVPPDYPNSARDRGVEGWVDLTVRVAPSGEVLDARVEHREGAKSFERAALAAVRKWRYEASGANAPLDIPVRVAFKLED